MADITVEFRDLTNALIWQEDEDYSAIDRSRIATIVLVDGNTEIATYSPVTGQVAASAFFRRRIIKGTSSVQTIKFFGFPSNENESFYVLEGGVVTSRTLGTSIKYGKPISHTGEYQTVLYAVNCGGPVI